MKSKNCKNIDMEALAYAGTIIEYIGRMWFIPRSEVVKKIGVETIRSLYDGVDVWSHHINQGTASILAERYNLVYGVYDSEQIIRWKELRCSEKGRLFASLAVEISGETGDDAIETLYKIYESGTSELANKKRKILIRNKKYLKNLYNQTKNNPYKWYKDCDWYKNSVKRGWVRDEKSQ